MRRANRLTASEPPSARAVGAHLSRVFPKLGITGRGVRPQPALIAKVIATGTTIQATTSRMTA